MITRITGQVERVDPGSSAIELAVGPVVREVLVTDLVRRGLQQKIGQQVTLHTLEFLEGSPGRGNLVPRLVGFLSEVEREFFDLICEVDGVGSPPPSTSRTRRRSRRSPGSGPPPPNG